jgi:hypothetical protein
MSWSRPFGEPIPLPDGGELRTLLDAARYVDALPRGMYEREEWQMVMEVLLSAVEGREAGEIAANCSHAGPAGKRPDERATAPMRPIINAVESALGQSYVDLVALLSLPVFPMNRHSREPSTCLKGATRRHRQPDLLR